MQQWATALVGYRGLRSDLLIELKKAQPLTAKELGARFGLTANALRRLLKELEAAGLVHYRREVRGVGGPRFAYSLSADGEALFPRAHAPALVDALAFLRESEGPEAVVTFFRRRWAGIVAESGLDVAALGLDDRVQLLAELLTSQGYMAEASGGAAPAAGGLTLRKYNCALREVAERFPELCAAEVEFMEEVLGARLDRRAHLLAGCNMCEYRVLPAEGAAGAEPNGAERDRSQESDGHEGHEHALAGRAAPRAGV
jgi:DeoR family suf operon transcriptional repressor